MIEHLSALLDDEAGDFEKKRVLDELKASEKLRNKLSSFALIGETMRSVNVEKPAINAGASFLSGIQGRIEAEGEYKNIQLLEKHKENENSKSWLRPVGGFALAASVAAIAVLGIQNYQLSNSSGVIADSTQQNQAPGFKFQEEQLAKTEATSVMPATNKGVNMEEYAQANSQTRSLLKRYVDSHMQYASNTTFVPSVRVIAYADYK